MTERPQGYRSQLAQFASNWREGDAGQAWALCEAAWHEHGTLGGLRLSEVEERRGRVAARKCRMLARELFGERRARR